MSDATFPWQSVGALATVAIAIFTFATAVGAIAAAIFAYKAIGENRRFNRTRLTVDLFETESTKKFTRTLTEIVEAHPTLTVCRLFLQGRFAMAANLPKDERQTYLDILGVIGYAGDLYAEGVLDKELFLARASAFIAIAFFIFEPVIYNFLRGGVLNQTLVTLARECVQYRNRIPRAFDGQPELRTYNIPKNFGT